MSSKPGDLASVTSAGPEEDLPEVELVSLLEDQLPQYTLRADALCLYQHRDWSRAPRSGPDGPPGSPPPAAPISPLLAQETFRYMILGTDRVEQMTKTYNDIDMVTHLLAERDRDLELAARIGQALLKRNRGLSEQNEALEEQLAQAFDRVNQLQHELSKKEELLRLVSIASEESDLAPSCSTPLRFHESFSLSRGLLQLDVLQDKLKDLEEENLALRSKVCHIKTETITYEEKEQQLVSDCVKELRETNAQMSRMTDELAAKSDELIRYQEEISSLLSQIVDLQHKIKEHVIEKEELRLHLQASKDAQRQLTMELHELQDRNVECLGMLHECREEVKELRSHSGPAVHLHCPPACGPFSESLAAEIEGTMRKERSLDEDSPLCKQKGQQKRVFDTVKVANDTLGRSASFPALQPIPGSNRSGVVMTARPFQSSLTHSASPTQPGPGNNSGEEEIPKDERKGDPPGSDGDLATALHRLRLRRQNDLSERRFFAEAWDHQLRHLGDGEEEEAGGSRSPPPSFASPGTFRWELTDLSAGSSCLRAFVPEKLQIVKPLEGSQTLHQWQQLARPNLATILDARPGVLTKGSALPPERALYRLSDPEEDHEEAGGITFRVQPSFPGGEAPVGIFLPPGTSGAATTAPLTAVNPGKCLSSTNSTFTFTTCRILHPSDVTQVTPSSVCGTPMSGGGGGGPAGPAAGPPAAAFQLGGGQSLSRRGDSTSTFSSTVSLAQLLQERGISARVRPGPASPRPPPLLLPPATPPNSPSRSPCPSPGPFEPRVPPCENFLASRPAESFLRELYGPRPTRTASDVSRSKGHLVERLKRLGIARPGAGGEGPPAKVGLPRPDSAVLLTSGGNLLGGLRRNQSLPVLLGALGAPACAPSPKMDPLKED
ncbi:trafficking kinesin-binding protein 2 isoform X2 [Ornithorhynchus anatinus]|uniref:trafficking kinesin-binding protein 2 isoform X2 n=1 Tax=Ornithorhynchus anatinus TaxID=9258 RepID=UPI0010A79917|nr:trafficking kinesin-binding protein 2 isoform X2 [Ornithorhynchus anatinus]